MDLSFTPEEQQLRNDVRAWVRANLPADISHKVHSALRLSRDDMQRWARILGTKGWLGWGSSNSRKIHLRFVIPKYLARTFYVSSHTQHTPMLLFGEEQQHWDIYTSSFYETFMPWLMYTHRHSSAPLAL